MSYIQRIQHLIEMLNSDDPNERLVACKELRDARHPLSQEVIDALKSAAIDSNSDVANAAQQTLALHAQIEKQDQGQVQREELWAKIFPLSIVISLVSAPCFFQIFILLGLGGWALEGVDAILGGIIMLYLFVHPLIVIVCPIISWYLNKKNKHTTAIVWAIVPIVGVILVAVLEGVRKSL